MDVEKGQELKAQVHPIDREVHLSEELRARWGGKEYAIQPMTAESCYPDLGDVYNGCKTADEWKLPNPGPYLQYVKKAAEISPRMAWLGHWMEVTASPLKWKFLQHYPGDKEKGHCAERAQRVNVCILDYPENGLKPEAKKYDQSGTLRAALKDSDTKHSRLVIIEDLSRDVIEVLGSIYDIDPDFFRSHTEDYVYYNLRYIYAEVPKLSSPNRQHFCLQNLRGRYFDNEKDLQEAQVQTGLFNVQRRLDSDRISGLKEGLLEKEGASVALTRAKTSLWVKPRRGDEPLTAVLLVDPSVTLGHPCWGGHQPFEQMIGTLPWDEAKKTLLDAPQNKSLFDQVLFWQSRLTSNSLDIAKDNSKFLILPTLQIITADWLISIQYMATVIASIEWDIERRPNWGDKQKDIDLTRKMISPWRRNIHHYQDMVQDMYDNLFNDPVDSNFLDRRLQTYADRSILRALRNDLLKAQRQIQEIRLRAEKIQDLVNNENNADAFRQNKSIGRLTLLATLFLPLNFAATFLSMSSDFQAKSNTLWLFFAIGVPLLLIIFGILKAPMSSRIIKL